MEGVQIKPRLEVLEKLVNQTHSFNIEISGVNDFNNYNKVIQKRKIQLKQDLASINKIYQEMIDNPNNEYWVLDIGTSEESREAHISKKIIWSYFKEQGFRVETDLWTKNRAREYHRVKVFNPCTTQE